MVFIVEKVWFDEALTCRPRVEIGIPPTPDLVTTAKGIAGGLPLAGVTGRAHLMNAVHPGGLGGTYGGNPVACAAALASITTMREHDLAGAARRIEATATPELDALAARCPAVGQIRGRGAMLALELIDPATGAPDPGLTTQSPTPATTPELSC